MILGHTKSYKIKKKSKHIKLQHKVNERENMYTNKPKWSHKEM